MTELSQSLMTHKRNSERLLCACCMMDPAEIRQHCGWLAPDSFTDEQYRAFWKLFMSGTDPAAAAVSAGCYTALVDAQSQIVSLYDYRAFADGVSSDKRYLDMAVKLPELAKALTARDEKQVNTLVEEISSRHTVSSGKTYDACDVAGEFADYIADPPRTIDSGIAKLDRNLGGFERGTITLIAARPSVGKSTLAFQMARNMARSGFMVAYFSLEMTRIQLWAKAACGVAQMDWVKVRRGELTEAEKQRIADANTTLMNALEDRLIIDDTSRITSEEIWRRCSQIKPDAIYVDHTSLVGDDDSRWNENKRIGTVLWRGKQLAKEFRSAVFYVTQLNRDVETRADKHPVLADLRDSGELEQTADNVLMMYREDYHDGSVVQVSKTELTIAKSRDGARNGFIKLNYDLKRQWFFDPETYDKDSMA